ncbi:MAG: type II toxin-antitoxin system RelE/ParE family toxin [Campylobacteraceae bacterium]|nr:type II toxin-antitoxin system RelE/ParE family toxin [Campylobacteraceae bacterium]
MIIQTERFKNELNDIIDFIARDSERRAIKFSNELFTRVSILDDFPYIGRQVDSKNKREFIYKGYVIPYIVKGDDILVLGIYKQNIWKP